MLPMSYYASLNLICFWFNGSMFYLFLYLSELEWIFIVEWIKTIWRDNLCPELLPDGVGREPIHVHLNVGSYTFVWQELTRYDLNK